MQREEEKQQEQRPQKRVAYIVGNYDYTSRYVENNSFIGKVPDLAGVKQEVIDLDERNSEDPKFFSLKKVLERFNFEVKVLTNIASDLQSRDENDFSQFGFQQLYHHIKNQIQETKENGQEIVVFFSYQGHGLSRLDSPNSQYALCCDYKPFNIDFLGSLAFIYDKCTIIGVLDCSRDFLEEKDFQTQNYTNVYQGSNAVNQSYVLFKPKATQVADDFLSITRSFKHVVLENPEQELTQLGVKLMQENKTIEMQGGFSNFKFQ